MLTRTVIILVFLVLALAVMQSGHLDALRHVADNVTPWSWNPDATLLGLYTMIVMGVSSGSTRAHVKLDLTTIKQERIDELSEALTEINALAFDRAAAKLNAVRTLVAAANLAAEAAGKTANTLSSKLALLNNTAAAHDDDEVREAISKMSLLSTLLQDVSRIDVPDISVTLDGIDGQLKAIHEVVGEYDIDDTKGEIEGIGELGQELGKLARMFKGEPEPAPEA